MQVLARFIPVIFVGRSGSFEQSDSVFVRMKHQRAHFSNDSCGMISCRDQFHRPVLVSG